MSGVPSADETAAIVAALELLGTCAESEGTSECRSRWRAAGRVYATETDEYETARRTRNRARRKSRA